MIRYFTTFCLLAASQHALALEVDKAPFKRLGELFAEGYSPMGVSNSGNASFAMIGDNNMYLCFLADDGTNQAMRQKALLNFIDGTAGVTEIPNIPMVCVLTE